jgi:hypothetical protein
MSPPSSAPKRRRPHSAAVGRRYGPHVAAACGGRESIASAAGAPCYRIRSYLKMKKEIRCHARSTSSMVQLRWRRPVCRWPPIATASFPESLGVLEHAV